MTRYIRNIVYYIVSFDLIDPYSHNYDKIFAQVKNHFSTSCSILSTTCLIKSDENSKEILNWFRQCARDDKIRIFISEYHPEKRTYFLDDIITEHIKKMENSS